MGRRRRKVIRIPRRKLPAVFLCPKCGKQAIKVDMFKGEGVAEINCGSCGLNDEVRIEKPLATVDAYCRFTDRFYGGPQS